MLDDRHGDELNTLQYLFKFLDAYDFATKGAEEIQQEPKTLINASILGLIFEKINGYQDGAFFTPGFISEFMTRKTLRKAVKDKFAARLNSNHSEGERTGKNTNIPSGSTENGDGNSLTFTDISNAIGQEISITEANKMVNSITICDPAVGSGHFLVSSLNELLAIKSDLGILCDRDGQLLRDVNIEIENDELIVTHGNEEPFEYEVDHSWHENQLAERKIPANWQRIQKALFYEKRYIIENCLFGVDINPNSVKICRLRLWIELLKNTYYTQQSSYRKLEVLPNIDINIKTGNSLVSRFDLDSDLSSVFKDSDYSLKDYKEVVRNYKNTSDPSEKRRLQQLINTIKDEYSASLINNRSINKKLSKQRGRLELMKNLTCLGTRNSPRKRSTNRRRKLRNLKSKKPGMKTDLFMNKLLNGDLNSRKCWMIMAALPVLMW